MKRLFDDVQIRDTDKKWPDVEVGWIDAVGLKRIAFAVANNLNQQVGVQPVGRGGGVEANLGSATNVSANSDGIVNLNLQSYWASAISVTVTAAVAPTTGSITVVGIWE